MKLDEFYMTRCLELAQNCLGQSRPNPMVGCVIVYNSKIIGEGYTSPYGGAHAEVSAIHAVKDKSLLKKATLYVNLEPCAHFGKTPPCSDLIIEHQISRVVIGIEDPFKEVDGQGIKKLRAAGCDITLGILKSACYQINRRFFTFQLQKRPYIVLKWAESPDGFFDIKRDHNSQKEPFWITNKRSRQLVHKWRSEEQAVLVGTNTVLNDNPKLNVRSYAGHDPVRVIIDRELKIGQDHAIYDLNIKTLILNEKKQVKQQGLCFEKIDFNGKLTLQVCKVLYKYNLQSVLIEGGAQTLESFITDNLWDEARVFIGVNPIGMGLKAPRIKGSLVKKTFIDGDLLKIIENKTSG